MRGLVCDCNSLEWMHRTGLSRMPSALCVFNFTQLLSVARRGVTAPPRLCRGFLLPHSHGFWCIPFSWLYYFRPAQCFPAVALFFFFFFFLQGGQYGPVHLLLGHLSLYRWLSHQLLPVFCSVVCIWVGLSVLSLSGIHSCVICKDCSRSAAHLSFWISYLSLFLSN